MKTSKYLAISTFFGVALAVPAFLAPVPANAQANGCLGGPTSWGCTPVAQQYCPQLSYNLYVGSHDYYTQAQVSQLQQFLSSQGYYQPVTGYFGMTTRANVAQFQQQQGVYPVTGGVGPLTRAAIVRVCGGGTIIPTPGIFYLNTPFNLSAGQSAKQYQGQLDVTLNKINLAQSSWWYPASQSASITLGMSCPPGLYCAALWYPTQTLDITAGQSTSFQGYTVTLNSLANGQATFTVAQGSVPTPGPTVDLKVNGSDGPVQVAYGASATLSWTSANASSCSVSSANFAPPPSTAQNSMQNSITVGPIYQNTSYAITCTGVNGQTAHDSVAVTVASNGGNNGTVSAYPTAGYAPLQVTFTVSNGSTYFAVDFGDGTSASLQQGSITHTYYQRGTYTARFSSDAPCLHSNPACMMAVGQIGTATVTVY